MCLLTFIHGLFVFFKYKFLVIFFIAFRHGNRFLFVWIGILIYALNIENLHYWIPSLDNVWQAQGFLTLFGMRTPLSIILGAYHVFIYISYIFVQRY